MLHIGASVTEICNNTAIVGQSENAVSKLMMKSSGKAPEILADFLLNPSNLIFKPLHGLKAIVIARLVTDIQFTVKDY